PRYGAGWWPTFRRKYGPSLCGHRVKGSSLCGRGVPDLQDRIERNNSETASIGTPRKLADFVSWLQVELLFASGSVPDFDPRPAAGHHAVGGSQTFAVPAPIERRYLRPIAVEVKNRFAGCCVRDSNGPIETS